MPPTKDKQKKLKNTDKKGEEEIEQNINNKDKNKDNEKDENEDNEKDENEDNEKDKNKDNKKEENENDEIMDDEGEDEEGGIRIGDIYLPPPPPPACTFDSDGPRLIITHIENEFFKSYAGKQVLGPFHKSFTSIVGPNGSGKSNVIDSMLFVFGYRAQKIRSKKISVLIHNSEAHPNVQSCTVAVHFQKIIDKGDEEFDVVPQSQFSVARSAFKDNSSFYQVNGRKCQFKVVGKLLRENGIDLDHNRFLILQGEVEQISMMKPKAQTEHDTGMLEYLEDIIGSERFKEPIELLAKRVEELNDLRAEKLNRVKLVEKEKEELEEPKEEAVAYLRLENDAARRQNVLYQRYVVDCTKGGREAEERKAEVDAQMASVKEELAELLSKKSEKEAELKRQRKKLEEMIREKEKHSEKFKELESEDLKLQEELKHKNQKRKKLSAQLKIDTDKLAELQTAPEKNAKDIEECEGLREELEATRAVEEKAYHEAMASLNCETQSMQDEKAGYETRLIDLRRSVDEAKSALDIAQSELDLYLSTEQTEKRKLDQMGEARDKLVETRSARKQQISELRRSIPTLESGGREALEGLREVEPRLTKVEAELRTERAGLEEKRSGLQGSKSRGRVLDAIMEQARSGNLPGVLGRLGDLGGIDSRYDVAASTAIGPLDNIVVDTVDTGQRCIDFLKRNGIGTATFIALDKMERFRDAANSSLTTPENTPRLFDLINVADERVRTAFYYGARDTLVAKDLDAASRIAYGRQKRWRVVTLNGELFEPSGTISGGGRTVMRGRMGKAATAPLVSAAEVGKHEQKVDAMTAEVTQLRRLKAELQERAESTGHELKTKQTEMRKAEMEIEANAGQEQSMKKQLEQQQKRAAESASDPKKVAELRGALEPLLSAYEKAKAKAGEVERKVDEVHARIMEVTGKRMKGMKKKLEDVGKRLDKVKQEITRLKVATKTATRNATKMSEKMASMEAEVTEVEGELLAFKGRKAEIEKEAAEILDKLNAVTESEVELGEGVEELKRNFDAAMQRETGVRERKIEFDQQVEKFDSIVKENKAKIAQWKKQLSKLQLQKISFDDNEEESSALPEMEEEKLLGLDLKDLHYQLTVLQERLAQSKPNLAVLVEYHKKEAVYLERVSELEEITSRRDKQRKYHEDLRKQRLNEFMSGFAIVSSKLKEMYQMITLGGDAELELVDSLDPFTEGIVFSVRPPKKSWKNITNLSGGEKTLSSLALVFALHYYKPTPLYVMDEIDAALDFKNVSIVANYIKERTKNAQFVIISLRSQMFELADRLVGIYKTYNCTKTVAINPSNFVKKETPTQAQIITAN